MPSGAISYSVNGEQHVAIMGGRGFSGGDDSQARARNPGRIFAFKLGGTATLPLEPGPAPPPNPPSEAWPDSVVAVGDESYRLHCSRCHGGDTHSINIIPDLRRSAALTNRDLWQSIVIGGALEATGMISWRDFIDADAAESIRAYVGAQARLLQAAQGPQSASGADAL
jgi:quinohemoprotein ethanol dehydrogenase